MEKKTGLALVAALISLSALPSRAASSKCVAILPLASDKTSTSKVWDKASESSIQARGGCVVELDWETVSNMLGGEALRSDDLRDPAVMRRIGLLTSTDQVVSRFMTRKAGKSYEEAMMVDVGTGRVSRMRVALSASAGKKTARMMRSGYFGVLVDSNRAPSSAFKRTGSKASKAQVAALKTAFGIEPGETVAMRDAVADNSCASAQGRVDRLQREILDIKARAWASRIDAGAAEGEAELASAGMTDPSLKADFVARLKHWSNESKIPALTAAEQRRLDVNESATIDLIRRCDLPK